MFFNKLNCKLVTQLMILAAIFSSTNSAKAQDISPDNTLPNNSQINLENNITKITGGTQRGGNLFHSFEKFGIPTGAEAHFENNLDINNIINRVTGGNISNIDGLIKANGTANFFLINPNGIVFGENGRLDIGGSFVGTTANALGFGEDNFFSASNPESSSELLSINPNALFFNQINPSAAIENNSVAPLGLEDTTLVNPTTGEFTESFTPKGLQVDDGKSLLLVGSNVTMNGGGLVAKEGNLELGGLAATGTVGLNSDGNNFSLSFPEGVEKSNVTLTDGAGVIVAASDGGSIAVNARNLEMSEESLLLAGIDTRLGDEQSSAGNIDINVTDAIVLKDKSRISNSILTEARGQGGDINISTNSLLLETGAAVDASTSGEGNAENLTVNANDVQVIGRSLDGEFVSLLSTVTFSTGNGGNLNINTNSLLIQDGAFVGTGTVGEGNAGNLTVNASDVQLIGKSLDDQLPSFLSTQTASTSTGDGGNLEINTNTLLIQDGAVVDTSTFGEGNAGNLTVNASNVQVIGESLDGQFPSLLSAGTVSTGDGGNLEINTNSLLIQDGAFVDASTSGEGNAGNLTVNASNVQVIGESLYDQFPSLLSAGTASTGDGGDLNINTNTLLIQDGAGVNAATLGEGNAGNLTVNAGDVQVIGRSQDGQFASILSTQTQLTGDGGDLNINTNTLLIQDGASVNAATLGEGNAGNLTVNAGDVQVIGGQFPSVLSTATVSTGDGGDLNINTNTLLIQDGGQVNAATFGEGNAGNLTVNATDVQVIGESLDGQFANFLSTRTASTGDGGNLEINTNTLLIQDGGQVDTLTFGEGNAGNLTVNASNVQLIGISQDDQFITLLSTQSGLGSRPELNTNTLGDGGDLTINTDILQVEDGAEVGAEGFGEGRAGNLIINADSIRLNNNGLLTANTVSNRVNPERQQATISINVQDLILRNFSGITTNAAGENVPGGDINIDSGVILALENSDISANSANSLGGNVNIITQGIFGTQFREQVTDFSDITATGADSESSGSVTIDGLEQNPAETLTELPSIPVEGEVYQACQPNDGSQSEFYFTGNGGLPPNPRDFLTSESVDVDWVSLPLQVEKVSGVGVEKIKSQSQNRIVEATGLVTDKNGDVFLVAQADSAIGSKSGIGDASCLKE